MSDEIAIKVDHVSKTFKLPHEKNNSIKGAVVNFYKRKRTYEKQKVLNNVSFEIKEGEFFGIVGRNGSGKSTILKILAGIYSPSEGTIKVNGKLTPFIELGVGFNHELTGRENVFLNGALLGFSRREMNELYDDIVEFAELERFMDQKLKNYSSGMQVRLAFSIAIRAETDILLLDEVLAVGDAAFQQKCFNYFNELKKRNTTVVFISHDMDSVRKFCDRAAYVFNGKIEKIDTANKIAQRYIEDNFADDAASKHKKEHSRLPVQIKIEVTQGASIKQGDYVNCRLLMQSEIEKDVVVGASILKNGEYIGGYNTKKYNEKFMLKKGQNIFTVKIDSSSLSRGNYNIGCGVFEKDNFTPLGIELEGPLFYIHNDAEYKDGLANIDGEIIPETVA